MFMHTNPVKDYISELNLFLDKLFSATPVAEHVTRKLFIWLSNHDIDENIEKEIILPAGALFRKSGYALNVLVDCLVKMIKPEIDRFNKSMVRSPAEFLIDMVKEARLCENCKENDTNSYPFFNWLCEQAAFLGQDVGDVCESEIWNDYNLSPAQNTWLSDEMMNRRLSLKYELEARPFVNAGSALIK